MKILLTGAAGFLAWHIKVIAEAAGRDTIVEADKENWADLPSLASGCDAVIHLAGVNRGEPSIVEADNIFLAQSLVEALGDSSPTVIFSNSIHANRDDEYGRGKRQAAKIIQQWADKVGANFCDLRLPNVFGEYGKPNYNSVVATFVDCVVRGVTPEVSEAKIPLYYAQDAARLLLEATRNPAEAHVPMVKEYAVSGIWRILQDQMQGWSTGRYPDISSSLERQLFSCLQARVFADRPSLPLTMHSDERGSFIEAIQVINGSGQSSYSTTVPGVTRGNHYHLRKLERFVVMSGKARMVLKKVAAPNEPSVIINVTGDQPVAVDMPLGWAHNITNTGAEPLLTFFWISELFDPVDPDTFAYEVQE